MPLHDTLPDAVATAARARHAFSSEGVARVTGFILSRRVRALL